MTSVRQAIIIRRDMWLNTGLQISLANQASMRSVFADDEMRLISYWIDGGCPTDIYIAHSEGHLDKLAREARLRGLPHAVVSVIVNSVAGPENAVLAIGPEDPSNISTIVSGLTTY